MPSQRDGALFCLHLVIDHPQTGASGVVRQGRRLRQSKTSKITKSHCGHSPLQTARLAALLGQPSSLRPHWSRLWIFFRELRAWAWCLHCCVHLYFTQCIYFVIFWKKKYFSDFFLVFFLLKVPKCEIFDRSDFHDFYSFWVGDFGAKI